MGVAFSSQFTLDMVGSKKIQFGQKEWWINFWAVANVSQNNDKKTITIISNKSKVNKDNEIELSLDIIDLHKLFVGLFYLSYFDKVEKNFQP